MSVPTLAVALGTTVAALGVEAAVGYPQALFRRIGHPVTWLGALLVALDRRLNRDGDSAARRRIAGGLALGLLLLAAGGVGAAIQALAQGLVARPAAVLLLGLLASPCLAQRSLFTHVEAVRRALAVGSLPAARHAVGMIVGRDTARLDEAGIARAAIESLAENFSDGIVAPALYLAMAGLPGGLLYKAINTADSMIGHRTPRHAAFGFAAAKLDDAVNWPAARLAALLVVLAAALTPGAAPGNAWRIMRRDARGHPSPNAGWPEAAMAGALAIRLGGPRTYAGTIVEDAEMGDGAVADGAAIGRALRIYRAACGLNAAAILAAAAAAVLVS